MKPQDLGENLVMRNANKEDIPAILEHFRVVHGKYVLDELRAFLEHHPRFSWENSFIIANEESREVVSAIFLLENRWALDGIEISSVEMEAVGTIEAYRYRGHIRLLNDEYEKRVAQLQPVIQSIAGIPYFYRLFGYEYAADLGGGFPITPGFIPRLSEGQEEPVSIEQIDEKGFKEFLKYREKYLPNQTWYRPIQPEDAGYLMFETTSHDQEALFFYLVKEKGQTVGAFFLCRWEKRLDMVELYLDNYKHVDPVLRFAQGLAQGWDGIPVRVTPPHQAQVREYVSGRSQAKIKDIYAWYVKIPSIPRFIETIGPLLSERMKNSEFQDYTGTLTLTTYKEGFTLSFQNGGFSGISEKSEKDPGDYQLKIPRHTLTRLLMGYETLDELASHEPDVGCAATMKPIVRVLFPKLKALVNPYY